MNAVKDGWYSDINEKMWPGQAMSLQVDEILHHERSEYQDVLVFKRCVFSDMIMDNRF